MKLPHTLSHEMRYVAVSRILLSSTALNLIKANFVKNILFIDLKNQLLESSSFLKLTLMYVLCQVGRRVNPPSPPLLRLGKGVPHRQITVDVPVELLGTAPPLPFLSDDRFVSSQLSSAKNLNHFKP